MPNELDLLRDLLGPIVVTVETPPRGAFRHLPEALHQAALTGGVNGWTDDPALVAYLDRAAELGVIDAYRAGIDSGHGWAVCDVCGEAVLRARGNMGRTASGKLSRSKTDPIKCMLTPGCPGKHQAPSL